MGGWGLLSRARRGAVPCVTAPAGAGRGSCYRASATRHARKRRGGSGRRAAEGAEPLLREGEPEKRH